jgi:hypothetical protein
VQQHHALSARFSESLHNENEFDNLRSGADMQRPLQHVRFVPQAEVP